MALYRCYFFSAADHVLGPAEIVNAANDQSALERAREICAEHPACARVELWMHDRLIGQFSKTD